MAKSVQSLYRLLLDLFIPAEVRRIATCYYPDLVGTLPGELASGDAVAMEFASVLLRVGAIDAKLFQMLARERPRRREEIEEVMRVYVPDGSVRSEEAVDSGKARRSSRPAADQDDDTLEAGSPGALVVIDDSKLSSLAGDGEIAESVYVVLRSADEETVEFVAEPAFERRAVLTFHESTPVSLTPLWPAGASVCLDGGDAAWRLRSLPLGDAFPVKRGCSVAIRAGRVEHGWLLSYLRSEGRPTYYFVLLAVRR